MTSPSTEGEEQSSKSDPSFRASSPGLMESRAWTDGSYTAFVLKSGTPNFCWTCETCSVAAKLQLGLYVLMCDEHGRSLNQMGEARFDTL